MGCYVLSVFFTQTDMSLSCLLCETRFDPDDGYVCSDGDGDTFRCVCDECQEEHVICHCAECDIMIHFDNGVPMLSEGFESYDCQDQSWCADCMNMEYRMPRDDWKAWTQAQREQYVMDNWYDEGLGHDDHVLDLMMTRFEFEVVNEGDTTDDEASVVGDVDVDDDTDDE
jgi:hypothetical protein